VASQLGTLAPPALDVEAVRAQFPILATEVHGKPLVYLDSAATAQRPEAVLAAMDRFYRESYASVHRGVHTLSQRATEAYEAARARVARFLGAANLIPVVVEQVDTGRATLRLPGGRVGEAATGGRRFSPGAPALLMIRPEHLLVGQAEPPPGRLGLPVTCTDSIFQGAVRRLVLRAAGGGEPIDSLEAVCPQRTVVPGAALWASWEPQAARLLAPEGDEKARGTLQ